MDSPYAPQPQGSGPVVPTADPHIFQNTVQGQWTAVAKLIGGILLVLFALGMFVLNAFILQPGTMALHATTTLPMLMGVFVLSAAVASLRNPGRVEVTDEAIVFQPGPRIAWRDVAFASVDETAGGQQKRLRLLDHNGKTLGQVASSIERFDGLVGQVREKVGQHTPPEVTTNVRMKKARRQAALTAGGTLLLITAGVFIIHDAFWNRHVAHQLSTAAIEGTGVVTEKFVAPNGVTLRIRYTVTGADGQEAEHNVQVDELLFTALTVGDPVAVRYVPSEPEISQLISGEIKSNDIQDSPTMSFILGGVAIAISVFLAAVTVMFWKGYDFKIDGEGARFVPLGQ